MSDVSRDDRLLDLARRVLAGEAIDWEREAIAESEVREGMKQLQQRIGRRDDTTETIAATAPQPPSSTPHEGSKIGPYRIVRKLGEGGMGVVYEAEQERPRRLVALKVIRGGRYVDDNVLRLFQREIQALAHLSHPGIAQLYETGVTDDGMHFFAMELIRGVPLSEWLRTRGDGPVTPAELRIRLGIFRRICDAVAYAHQRGVIHRDLKPGNILIPALRTEASTADAVPEVKILDFGLARMTDTDVQMTTYVTEMGRIQGTLPYMSPEQVRGNPDEIDLRTDVYSLGVLLYEMVTGHLPYDLSKARLPDAVRIICEGTPKPPAATFTGTRRLDEDVATIAGTCLEKEPARRYQSVAALGEDVQRYLNDQPILARPPSAAYQFRKLVLRHKGPFAAAAGAFVLLLVFSISMTVQAARIARERDRANLERDRASQEAETARRVSDFLEGLFKVSDPWSARDKEVSPRELLDAGAERIERELKNQPEIQARLMKTIGVAYRGVYGRPQAAETFLKRAMTLTEATHGAESVEYADVLSAHAGMTNLEEQVRAHGIRSRLLAPDDPRLARSFYALALAQLGAGLPEAETSLRRALEVDAAAKEPDEQLRLWVLNDLALLLASRKEYHGALPLMRESMRIRERYYQKDHPDLIKGFSNLGWVLLLAGERQEARRYLQAALEAQERTLGPASTWNILQSLGELERQEGRLDRARSVLERSLAILDKNQLSSRFEATDTLVSLGLVAEAEGRLGEAVEHLSRACEIHSRSPGITLNDPAPDYARVLRKAGRIAEAEKIEASLKPEAVKP